jgi:hypothetical protein
MKMTVNDKIKAGFNLSGLMQVEEITWEEEKEQKDEFLVV